MKRILFSLLLVGLSVLSFAQDVIVKRDGTEIKSKVIEISDLTLKYRLFQDSDGPIRNINKSDVFMIIYQNGTRENFEKQQAKPIVKSDYLGRYFLVGVGVGNSYGGIGVKAQFRTGGKVGFGAHAGFGYLPVISDRNGVLEFEDGVSSIALGVNFYPYKWFYINAQVGVTGVERNEYLYLDYNNSIRSYYSNPEKLWGISTLVGGEWIWGSKIGLGFNAAIGPTFNLNSNDTPYDLAMDLGFIVRF